MFDVISRAPQNTFQVLTKRAERMALFFKDYAPPKNAWLGVTVEERQYGEPRLDWLRQVPAFIRFVSVEPLLEDVGKLDLAGIHWVIVGGESGPKARPMQQAGTSYDRDSITAADHRPADRKDGCTRCAAAKAEPDGLFRRLDRRNIDGTVYFRGKRAVEGCGSMVKGAKAGVGVVRSN